MSTARPVNLSRWQEAARRLVQARSARSFGPRPGNVTMPPHPALRPWEDAEAQHPPSVSQSSLVL